MSDVKRYSDYKTYQFLRRAWKHDREHGGGDWVAAEQLAGWLSGWQDEDAKAEAEELWAEVAVKKHRATNHSPHSSQTPSAPSRGE